MGSIGWASVVAVVLASAFAAVEASTHCGTEPTHTYGVLVSNGNARAAAGEAGGVVVADSNAADCDADGVPGDFDGDHDTGLGGGFFGYGRWAAHAPCGYGLNVHGGTVTVNDVLRGSDVTFVLGEDDQDGPAVRVDPVTGMVLGCHTNGVIAPGIDPDDCLSPTYTRTGATCGTGGGDGGYWLFNDKGYVAGTITAN